MKLFRADLHIHTACSPSADLEMSPSNIIQSALEKGLHIIGITDHNSTKQVKVIAEMAERFGLFVLLGTEITTKENIHFLVYMSDLSRLSNLQEYIEIHLLKIKNNPKVYGYQVIVDEEDN
ncbi:MAG: histidinol-phosphatase, partial [Bacteroidetes bacterium HGW-Bacteroidetes-21]